MQLRAEAEDLKSRSKIAVTKADQMDSLVSNNKKGGVIQIEKAKKKTEKKLSKDVKKLQAVDTKIAKEMKKMNTKVVKDDIKLRQFKVATHKARAAAEQAKIDSLKALIAPKSAKGKGSTAELKAELKTGDKGQRVAAKIELEGKEN